MDKITVRLGQRTREVVERNAQRNDCSISEYIRKLVEANVTDASGIELPSGLGTIVEQDVTDGFYRDEVECILHYIREGMRAEGRLRPGSAARASRSKTDRPVRDPYLSFSEEAGE